MSKGQKHFIEGEGLEYTTNNTDIASVEEGVENRKALFNCERTANGNLSGDSTVPNWDIDMTEAEFVVEKEGDNYTLYNELENVYLNNSDAGNYFAGAKVTHSLTKEADEDSFEIRRVSNDNKNNRYVYFFYERMAFDAVSAKNESFENKGDFAFEFLEKKDVIDEENDPIPGYQRVGEIVPGKKYLVTEYYNDAGENAAVKLSLCFIQETVFRISRNCIRLLR
ncbi:MAG: hypothetical protein K2P21_10110 [Lachnospiraceae bacterium]|nr:hypothetical protein [Lachnospiraceae bacterium]